MSTSQQSTEYTAMYNTFKTYIHGKNIEMKVMTAVQFRSRKNDEINSRISENDKKYFCGKKRKNQSFISDTNIDDKLKKYKDIKIDSANDEISENLFDIQSNSFVF